MITKDHYWFTDVHGDRFITTVIFDSFSNKYLLWDETTNDIYPVDESKLSEVTKEEWVLWKFEMQNLNQ